MPEVMTWRGRRGRILAAAALLGLAGSFVSMATTSTGRADTGVLPGVAVSVKDFQALVDAATSCPALSAAKLAGQIMEQSKFSPSGALGIAGLTDKLWEIWRPWEGAKRSDSRARVASGHDRGHDG